MRKTAILELFGDPTPTRTAKISECGLYRYRLDVRITCGPWQRTVTPSVTTSHGLTGVNLDPIYKDADPRLYRLKGEGQSDEVRAWAIENGEDPLLRITLCGRGTEHDETLDHGWKKYVWRKRDGETIWASPHCERAEFGPLFAGKNGAE